jgi:hypothetical protein
MARKTSPQDWKQVGTIPVGDPSSQIRAGAYGQVGEDTALGNKGSPIFLVGGIGYQPVPGTGTMWVAFIARSNGGETWTVTHTHDRGFVKTMAWDTVNKRFLAQCIANSQVELPPFLPLFDSIVLASPDGIVWTEIESVTNPEGSYASPLLIATGNPRITDGEFNVVPNGGYYGEDKTKRILIAPTALDPYGFSNGFVNDWNLIDVHVQDKKTGAWSMTTRELPMTSVHCVGFAGDVWEAGGTQNVEGAAPDGIIASSTDDGTTWAVVQTYPSSDIKCMMGASKSKFSGT